MRIKMEGIAKSFGGNKVLDGVSFDIRSGEIMALVGENGAGKSTLMKILTGVCQKDEGRIFVDGQEVSYSHPSQAAADGIVFIYQELNVMFDLTVEENMFMGREIKNKFGLLDRKAMRKRCCEVLEELGVHISSDSIIGGLSVGQQQMIEIAKALMWDGKVIIMDEPTAALTSKETETLFSVARGLQKKGVSIVYISHRLEEIFELCGRVTVLRDGKTISVKDIGSTDMNDLVKQMIGRDIGDRYPERKSAIGEKVLEVENLTRRGFFESVSFSVKAGEVLGVSGLMGAGRTEIMQSIFGAAPHDWGRIKVKGAAVDIDSPEKAISLGIGYITEDRKTEGLMAAESIMSNISLTNLKTVSRRGIMNKDLEAGLSLKAIKDLSIRCSGPDQACEKLSGGNQQKVVFGKWIAMNPQILILDEPTRGVDVGAKKEIYGIINGLAEKGVAVVMVSSELPEILGMSDRVMVVSEGRVQGFLANLNDTGDPCLDIATQENIMLLATGSGLHEKAV